MFINYHYYVYQKNKYINYPLTKNSHSKKNARREGLFRLAVACVRLLSELAVPFDPVLPLVSPGELLRRAVRPVFASPRLW